MTDQLYRWVNYPENKPKERKEYPILFRYENDRPKDKLTMDTTAWNGKKWDMGEGNTVVQFLEPYTPSPVSGSLEEAAKGYTKALKYDEPFTSDDIEAAFISGAAYREPELKQVTNDMNALAKMQSESMGWLVEKEKQLKGLPDELRKANPYDSNVPLKYNADGFDVWSQACSMLQELLNQKEAK